MPDGKSVDDVISDVQKLKPLKYAAILHDKDLSDDGVTPKEAHVHVVMYFENARSIKQVAKEMNDKPQYFEAWKGNSDNAFAYLIHTTKNARHKHQYSCDEVTANFDYQAYMERIMMKADKYESLSTSNNTKGMLDALATGEMTFKEVKEQVSGSVYAKHCNHFQKAHELFLTRMAEALYQDMTANHEMVESHWLYGASETGKTRFAKQRAESMGAYYSASTDRDAFQYYQGEPTIILDELRPQTLSFSELLVLLDPFSRGKTRVGSRYYNKDIFSKHIFITTPFSPVEFCRHYNLNKLDSSMQLYRRLSSVLLFDDDYIYKMEYDPQRDDYIKKDKKNNSYSRKNQPTYQLKNIFDDI